MANNKNRKRVAGPVAILENIIVELADGSFLKLDKTKIKLVDKRTNKEIFKETV
jgi:hypothetical protein